MATLTPSPSTRKLNWTQEELNILVSMVTDRWSVIKGKFTPGLTIQKKNSCWQEIADRYPLYHMFIVTLTD